MRNFLQNNIVKIILASIICLAVARTVLSNELANLGYELKSIDIDVESLKYDNELLNQKIASSSSLITIREKALSLGFFDVPQYEIINTQRFPVAVRKSH